MTYTEKEFEEIKAVTLNALKDLEECYVIKEEEVKRNESNI